MDRKMALTAAALAAVMSAGCAHMGGASVAKVECHGVNSCKGTSECGGPGHACAGQNSCKGQGWISLTSADCTGRGGTFTAKK